jgi:hypothetical protein
MKTLTGVFDQHEHASSPDRAVQVPARLGLSNQLPTSETQQGLVSAEQQLDPLGRVIAAPSWSAQLQRRRSIASRIATSAVATSAFFDATALLRASSHPQTRDALRSPFQRSDAFEVLGGLAATALFLDDIAGTTARFATDDDDFRSTLRTRTLALSANVQRPEIVSRVTAIRELMQTEQISEARGLLATIPSEAFAEPSMARLRRALTLPTARPSARQGTDRTQAYAWLRQHGHEHIGQWVAVSNAGLVASATTLDILRNRLRILAPVEQPLIHKL